MVVEFFIGDALIDDSRQTAEEMRALTGKGKS